MSQKILIGKKIREIRNKSGLTQEQFCEKIGIEPPSLSNIENGKSYPSMQTVLNIMYEFKVAPQDFFDNEYYQSNLEEKIIDIIKKLPSKNKQIIYRVIECFDI